jgi:hypothetical protein
MRLFSTLSTLFEEFTAIEENLHATAPEELLDGHGDIVGMLMCGLLFREGLDHPQNIRMASGSGLEQARQRINRMLMDPRASSWYFSTLDRLSLDQGRVVLQHCQEAV